MPRGKNIQSHTLNGAHPRGDMAEHRETAFPANVADYLLNRL
jgi:hypothetical protein